MSDVPHVALLIETSRSYGRALLRGIHRYIAEHGPWSVFMELRALETQAPPWLKNWNGDGILTRTGSPAMAKAVARAGVPTVELRSTRLKQGFPFLGVDNVALGRMIAEHLLERGFRHFGAYQIDIEEYFEQRLESFVATLAEHGYTCDTYHARGQRERPAEWERAQDDLAAWAAGLTKPAGVMACTDQLGFWLLDACRRAGVRVPEELAVVGVENDESLCTMATPPLSSVPLNGERIGYRAAEILAAMMRGGDPPPTPLLVPPQPVVTRQSSDVVAVEVPELAAALRYIRHHACEGKTVRDLLAAVAVSRSSLERGFRQLLGRSPNQEFLRVKLNRVRELLLETDLTLEQIAPRAGFEHVQYMSEAFRKRFEQSPGAYRRTAKL